MTEDLDEIVRYRLARAREALEEARVLATTGHWNTCVNRLYYACFYCVSACLVQAGLSSSKHTGLRGLFGTHFVKPGLVPKEITRIYYDLFEYRQEGDYDDFVRFNGAQVTPWIAETERFVDHITAFVLARSQGQEKI